MTTELSTNYKFLNILSKTLLFIKRYPQAYFQIVYKNLLLGIVTLLISLIMLFIISLFDTYIIASTNTFLLLIFFMPITVLAEYASFKSLKIVAVYIYRKCSYQDSTKLNLFQEFFKIYSLIFQEIFSKDILLIFIFLILIKLIIPSLLTSFGIITIVYIAANRFSKLIKLQCLPFTYLLEKIDDKKSLLERVYRIPISSILVMNLYELIIFVCNLVPWSLTKLILPVTSDDILLSIAYLILIYLPIIFITSFSDLLCSIYYDCTLAKHYEP